MCSKTSNETNDFERKSATALRLAVFLLGAYVVFRRIFPFVEVGKRFIDITIGEFLLVVFEVLLAIAASGFLVIKGFKYPNSSERNRIWCERWSGVAFGIAAIIMAAISVALLEHKGFELGLAQPIAHGILWLLL